MNTTEATISTKDSFPKYIDISRKKSEKDGNKKSAISSYCMARCTYGTAPPAPCNSTMRCQNL